MRPSPTVRKWLRRTAVFLGVVLGLLLLVLLLLQTPWGRERAGRLLEAIVTSEIAGGMRIDEVEAITFTRARVRGLVFHDPRGVNVLSIEEAEVHFVWSALLTGTIRLDEAHARGVELVIDTGEQNSTSIEDAFSAPEPDGGTDGVKVMLDHITVEDAAVRILAGAGVAVHVSQAIVRVTHDLSLIERGLRPTDVILSDVYGNFYAEGYESISGTDVRATGSIFDMRMRVCHPRGVVALRIRLGGEQPRFTYTADRMLMNIALRWVDRLSALTLESGQVSLRGVPRCGPPPS
jgi:hypothetical protein